MFLSWDFRVLGFEGFGARVGVGEVAQAVGPGLEGLQGLWGFKASPSS